MDSRRGDEVHVNLLTRRKSLQILLIAISVILTCTCTFGIYLELSKYRDARKLTRPTRRYSVTVDQIGRLGNQMLQYAALIAIADRLNMVPFVKPGTLLTQTFDIPHVSNSTLTNAREFDSSCCTYIPFPVSKVTSDWHMYGFFRSWKYFANSSKLVRESFRFKKSIAASAKQFLRQQKRPNCTLVAIHVRRGDFLDTASVNFGRKVAGMEYIKRAQQYFLSRFKNVQFLVLGNDITWCRQNIKGTNVIHSLHTNPGVDMALMSMCDHVIMTVGSFGWWGGWLADGITVYYEQYMRPGSSLYNLTIISDVYPPEWIPMS